jgi:hypothetical protein
MQIKRHHISRCESLLRQASQEQFVDARHLARRRSGS